MGIPPPWEQGLRPNPAAVGQPMGFWIRVVAYLIDYFIIAIAAGLIIGGVAIFVALAGGFESDGQSLSPAIIVGFGLGIVALFVVNWLYEAVMTSSARGATWGKQAIGAHIVRADGERLSFGRATVRHFLKVIITPMVPLGIGYMLAGWTTGKRALHDLLAETLVVSDG
jgi:uncharacterized RDD family membrane protein YckC